MNHYLKTVLFKFKMITSKMNTIIPKKIRELFYIPIGDSEIILEHSINI